MRKNEKKIKKSKTHLEFLQKWKLKAATPKEKETNELIKGERKKNRIKKICLP